MSVGSPTPPSCNASSVKERHLPFHQTWCMHMHLAMWKTIEGGKLPVSLWRGRPPLAESVSVLFVFVLCSAFFQRPCCQDTRGAEEVPAAVALASCQRRIGLHCRACGNCSHQLLSAPFRRRLVFRVRCRTLLHTLHTSYTRHTLAHSRKNTPECVHEL